MPASAKQERTMPDLRLQPEIEPAARWLGRKLTQVFGEGLRLRIGGGSILAARHHHRLSTDLDLWWDKSDEHRSEANRLYASRVAQAPRWVEDALGGDQWKDGRPGVLLPGTVIGMLTMGVELPAGVEGIEVTIVEREFEKIGARAEDRVRGTLFEPQTDAQILWGKMQRMKEGQVHVRDLYDLGVMSHLNPQALRYAFGSQGGAGRRDVGQRLRYTRVDGEKRLLRVRESGWTPWKGKDAEDAKQMLIQALSRNDPAAMQGSVQAFRARVPSGPRDR